MSVRPTCHDWVIVAVLILLTHLLVGWLFVGGPVTSGDSADYLRLAENLLSGNGYSLEGVPPFTPTATRPPGYPLALIVFLGFGRLPLGWVLLWQALIAGASAGALVFALGRFGVSRWAAISCSLVVGLFPSVVAASARVLTEAPTTWIGILAGLALHEGLERAGKLDERPGRGGPMLLLCGALAGVLTLMRPEYLAALVGFAFVPLVAVFGQAPVPRRTRLLAAGLVLVGGLGVTAPWVLRNAVVMDRPIVTSDFWGFTPRGYTMWVNSWIEHPRHVLTTYNRVWPGGLYERSAFPDYAFRSAAELDTVEQLLERRIGLDLLGSEEDERFAQLARERTAAATMASFVVRPIKRIVLCWFYLPRAFPVRAGSVLQTVRGVTDLLRPAVLSLAAAAALSLGLLLCGLAGAVVTLFERRPLPLAMTVILGLRLVVVGWLVLPVPRYVIQAVPAVAVLSLFLAGWLWRRLRPTTGLA